MTAENKPVPTSTIENEAVHTGEGTSDSSNFQPTIDTNQAGATEAYGEGSIQILEGLEAVRPARCNWIRRIDPFALGPPLVNRALTSVLRLDTT